MRGASPRQRLIETIWELVGQTIFRCTFHNWYGIRRRLLNVFGARVHPTARIRPSVTVSHPWHLEVGAHATVGDHAILFCLGPIRIGERTTVSQYAHLCAGGHDYTRADMPLIADPIVIGDGCWIAADVFIGPGVTIGTDTVVGARSTVVDDLPPASICAGDPARPRAEREIRVGAPPRREMPQRPAVEAS